MTAHRAVLALLFAPLLAAGCGRGPTPPAATAQPAATAATSGAGDVAPAGGFAPDQRTLAGTVAETMNSGGYTYALLKSGGKDLWIAAPEQPLKVGEAITVAVDMSMDRFHSKTLNRDFDTLYFVSRVAREGESLAAATPPSGMPAMAGSHGGEAPQAPAAPPTVTPNAPPAGGHAIADVWAKKDQLAGKPVVVRGTVVKVNNGIMDRNWLHLRDGSGAEKDGTNDLTVTTADVVKVGDVVTMSGTLGTKKDFGAGYAYDAILEQASVKR